MSPYPSEWLELRGDWTLAAVFDNRTLASGQATEQIFDQVFDNSPHDHFDQSAVRTAAAEVLRDETTTVADVFENGWCPPALQE
jgi:hypothetical protein